MISSILKVPDGLDSVLVFAWSSELQVVLPTRFTREDKNKSKITITPRYESQKTETYKRLRRDSNLEIIKKINDSLSNYWKSSNYIIR